MNTIASKFSYSSLPSRKEARQRITELPKLLHAIDEMNEKYPRSNLVVKIDEPMDVAQDRFAYIPCGDMAGVYVIFDMDGKLTYIGKAPGNLDGRLIKHGRLKENTPDGNGFHFIEEKFIEGKSRYLVVIPLLSERAFEGASIEEFLIRKLAPPLNEKFRA